MSKLRFKLMNFTFRNDEVSIQLGLAAGSFTLNHKSQSLSKPFKAVKAQSSA